MIPGTATSCMFIEPNHPLVKSLVCGVGHSLHNSEPFLTIDALKAKDF